MQMYLLVWAWQISWQQKMLPLWYYGKVRLKDAQLLADWRQFPGRFPYIERAARRFADGNPQKDDLYLLMFILAHQAEWHGINLGRYGRVNIQRIERMADRMRMQQIDPYLWLHRFNDWISQRKFNNFFARAFRGTLWLFIWKDGWDERNRSALPEVSQDSQSHTEHPARNGTEVCGDIHACEKESYRKK